MESSLTRRDAVTLSIMAQVEAVEDYFCRHANERETEATSIQVSISKTHRALADLPRVHLAPVVALHALSRLLQLYALPTTDDNVARRLEGAGAVVVGVGRAAGAVGAVAGDEESLEAVVLEAVALTGGLVAADAEAAVAIGAAKEGDALAVGHSGSVLAVGGQRCGR